MNWLWQKKGLIKMFNSKIHRGIQPVRVLHHMNLFMFQNTTADFTYELKKAIKEGKIEPRVDIIYGESPITHGPFIDAKRRVICLDETFLSYLWCITHSIYTLYVQCIDYPRLNKVAGFAKHDISNAIIEDANELFAYGRSLIKVYSKWDIDRLPNPEVYSAEKRDFIEQPNSIFTEAVKFILLHEYIHAITHLDQINTAENPISHFLDFEKEADFRAIELQKLGIFPNKINEIPVQLGITIGILSMFYFAATTDGGERHPNHEDRLVSALSQLNLAHDSVCWGVALIGLEMWTSQFGLKYEWDKNKTDKDAFEDFIIQIKQTANS